MSIPGDFGIFVTLGHDQTRSWCSLVDLYPLKWVIYPDWLCLSDPPSSLFL